MKYGLPAGARSQRRNWITPRPAVPRVIVPSSATCSGVGNSTRRRRTRSLARHQGLEVDARRGAVAGVDHVQRAIAADRRAVDAGERGVLDEGRQLVVAVDVK